MSTEDQLRESNRRLAAALEELRESNHRLEAALDELRRAQSQLLQQERLRALGEMAAGVAHDLNNALAPVVGFSELLLADPAVLREPARATQYLELVRTGAEDAAGVVMRLREFYRPREEGEPFAPVDLPRLCDQVARLTEPRWKDQAQAAGKSLTLELDLAEVPRAAGAEAELREALTNLVFNAVDATPAGTAGTITLRTRARADAVCVEVADTGEGMSEEVRQRALEPFFTTKGEHGTGLGLSMVYGTARRHNGALEIESEVGRGTTVRLVLPAWSGEVSEDHRTPPGAEAAGHPVRRVLRVLLVDDEPLVRRVTAALLEADGHTAVAVDSGGEALARLDGESFDVVLTDLAMPGMGGAELAREAKRLAPRTPVLLLTGFSGEVTGEDDGAEQPPEHVDAVVGKPLTLGKLRRALAAVLSQRAGDTA